MPKTFLDIRNKTALYLNYTPNSVDQDFTTAQLKEAVNDRYMYEVNLGRQEGSATWFKTTYGPVTWPADQVTLQLPAPIKDKLLMSLEDITANENNPIPLAVFDTKRGGQIWWKDRQTLQWGTNGPPSAKTIRATYIADAEELTEDTQEPILLPESHRELIALSAAIQLRLIVDERAPQAWLMQLNKYRVVWYLDMAQGRPHTNERIVRNTNYDARGTDLFSFS